MLFKPEIDASLPSAIVLGGRANALSVARSLRRKGVRVVLLGSPYKELAFSRFCEVISLPEEGDIQTRWLQWFTGKEGKSFRGAAIIPCGDDGLEFIVHNRSQLQNDFLIYEANDHVLDAMLDKAKTHLIAKEAGIPVPEVWVVSTDDDIRRIMNSVQYPCGLKPRLSHEFKKYFKEKLFVAHDASELQAHFARVEPYKLEMVVTEIVPGGDRGYCSFYSFIDEQGRALFHFTKQKPRQNPIRFGLGTFHVTDWNPEVAELGLKFLQGIGLRGLANVEFKRDPRDGKLKLIECNHRFTEPNEMMQRAGLDFASLVYNRLTSRPLPPLHAYRKGLCLVKPWEDVKAFYTLHRLGELSWREWLRSFSLPMCFLYFQWRDPIPWAFLFLSFWKKQLTRVLTSVRRAAGMKNNDANTFVRVSAQNY